MNKIISIKKTSSIFLATVLVLGTIGAFSPSSITASAQADSYYDGMDDRYNSYEPEFPPQYAEKKYNSYEQPEYETDRYEKPSYKQDYYEPKYTSYGKDNNSYKSKKDSVSINKLNCINNNVNINGNNTGDINVGNSGSSATGSGADEGYLDIGSSDGYGEGYDNGYKKQKGESFTCIINNNNINNNFGTGNATEGNVTEPLTCEECFREFLTEEQIEELIRTFETGIYATLDQVCLNIDPGISGVEEVISTLEQVLGPGQDDTINNIIECLLEVGGIPTGQGGTAFNLP